MVTSAWDPDAGKVTHQLGGELARDINPTDACRTPYSPAIDGTDGSGILPNSGTAATYFWPG